MQSSTAIYINGDGVDQEPDAPDLNDFLSTHPSAHYVEHGGQGVKCGDWRISEEPENTENGSPYQGRCSQDGHEFAGAEMAVGNIMRCAFTVTMEPFDKTVNAHADIETAESHIGIYLAVEIDAGIDHGAHGADYPKEWFLMEFKPQVYEAEYEPHCLDCVPEIHAGKLPGYI